MKDIVLDLLPELTELTEDYIDAIVDRYKMFIQYSQIPSICYGFSDTSIIPDKLNKLFSNIYIAIKDRYNILFNFKNYENISYLFYLLMQQYFRYCIINDLYLENVLYIDTKLLVEDYKRLMNIDKEELSPIPVHSMETLYRSIEEAAVVIWDKFMLVDSAYDKDKIFDIINIRNRKGLCNFYISVEDPDLISRIMGNNIANEMHVDVAFQCINCNLVIKNTKEVSIFR